MFHPVNQAPDEEIGYFEARNIQFEMGNRWEKKGIPFDFGGVM